jgi:hypothetical protein
MNRGEFVFAPRPNKPLSTTAMGKVLRRMEIESATVYGFRSGFRDWAGNETNFPREVTETALAHVIGDKGWTSLSAERRTREAPQVDGSMGGILRTTSVSQRGAHAWRRAELIFAILTLKCSFRFSDSELWRSTTTPTIATATATSTIASGHRTAASLTTTGRPLSRSPALNTLTCRLLIAAKNESPS